MSKELAPPKLAALAKVMGDFYSGDPALIHAVVEVSSEASPIPLDDDSSIRAVRIALTLYMGLIDVIVFATGKNRNHAAEVWRNMPDDFKNELEPYTKEFQFSGIPIFAQT